MRLTTKRAGAAVAIAAIVGGVVAGGVVAASLAGHDDPEAVLAALDEAPMVRVADIGRDDAAVGRGVFVQTTSAGHLCLWDAPSASSLERKGGCNSIDDPLGGSKLSASLSYEGGPEAAKVAEARLIGLVARDVASVQVLMSDGTHRIVPMRRQIALASAAGAFRAFGYQFSATDLAKGLGPTAVLALDSSGKVIDRQATGFGG